MFGIAYDLEPFIWYNLFSGKEASDNLQFPVVSGCAHEYSDAGKIVYSSYGRNICVLNIEQMENNSQVVNYIYDNMRRLGEEIDEKDTDKKSDHKCYYRRYGTESFCGCNRKKSP